MNIYNHSMGDRTPYTYLIGWSKHNIWYYGVRFGKNCHPSDLWKTYFTSSKHVKKFRASNGEPDVVQIRRYFSDINKARQWEDSVIQKMNMVLNTKFLNLCSSTAISPEAASAHSKGKTYEEIYGIEKAKILKEKRSQSNKERTWKFDKSKVHGNAKMTGKKKWFHNKLENKNYILLSSQIENLDLSIWEPGRKNFNPYK